MFDKLNAYEKAIVMFFAINYGNEITKKIYTKYAAKIIPQPFCYEVLESLMQQQFVSKVVSYYFRFSSVRFNRLRNKLLANYLRNRGNDLATVQISAICGAMLSNNSSWIQI